MVRTYWFVPIFYEAIDILDLAGFAPEVILWSGGRQANLNARVASVMERFEDFCAERFEVHAGRTPTEEEVLQGRFPAAVIVHGDTSSAMAAALSAFHMQIPVMHVEAGLRTDDIRSPFPEELNRQVIGRTAAMHFAPTVTNLQNLVRENVPAERIYVTGNTGIDALLWASTLDMTFHDTRLQALYESDRRIVVVTAHRRENWGAGLEGIAEGVAGLAALHPDVHFVLPVHPNPQVEEVLAGRLSDLDNVLLIAPLGYATFSKLLGRCHLVLTDSGGIQEEAPSLGKPVLVMRETTERSEGVTAGTLRLVGTDPALIVEEGRRLLEDPVAYAGMSQAENPYGDGRAAERIVAALEHLLIGGSAPVPFGPGYDRAAVGRAAGPQFASLTSARGVPAASSDGVAPIVPEDASV